MSAASKRRALNYVTSVALLITLIIVVVTGVLKFPGLLTTLGMSPFLPPYVTTLHDWSGITMAFFIILHLLLNWRWLTTMTRHYLRT